MTPRSRGDKAGLFLAVLTAIISVCVYLAYRDTTPPLLRLDPLAAAVSRNFEFTLTAEDEGSGIKSLKITAVRRDRRVPLLEMDFPKRDKKVSVSFSLEKLPFDDGEFTLEIEARDGSLTSFGRGALARLSRSQSLDTQPPVMAETSIAHNINQGGCGLIRYKVSEPVLSTGIKVGELFFPGYKQADGDYACIFAFPYFMDKKSFSPRITAVDQAGNTGEHSFNFLAKPKNFRQRTISLPDSFLGTKSVEFQKDFPGEMTPLQRYLKVNREMRTKNRKALYDIALNTSPAPLWSGPFIPMEGEWTALFGDHRDYLYNGEKVDEQTHLGIDIADVKNAPIPAANAGKVLFVGNMGIYGRAVIIDHGMGLQTLYAHLNEYLASEGETVKKGQAIGKTGVTGLAGGDHLHFGILASGLPVNPIEWFDDHWIEDNVADRLALPQTVENEKAEPAPAEGEPKE